MSGERVGYSQKAIEFWKRSVGRRGRDRRFEESTENELPAGGMVKGVNAGAI